MRVLVIDECIPYPLNSGKRLRTYNLLINLAKRHEIFFVCHQEDELDSQRMEQLTQHGIACTIAPKAVRRKAGLNFYLALLANLFSAKPYIVTSHSSAQIKSCVKDYLTHKPFDLIHCEWTPYTENIIGFNEPKVLSAQNVEAQIWNRYFENEPNPIKKMYIGTQKHKIFDYEKVAMSYYQEIIAVSEQDKKLLQNWYGTQNITVVPNGVDTEYFKPLEIDVQRHNLVFTGSMDWRPNQDAVNYLLDAIFPLIRRQVPDVSLVIAGRNPPRWLARKVNSIENVTLTGTVEDIRPYIARGSICIVPLRIGGGSRLKILEYLAMKKPVVSTTIGAEGLNVKEGVQLILADQSESFAQKILELFENPSLGYQLGERGRQLVVEQYDWKIIANILDQVWHQAVANPRHAEV